MPRHLAPTAAVAALAIMLTACAPAITEEQMDAAWDVCVDAFNDRPEVIQQAWTDEYEWRWKNGGLWWEFGAGDICDDIQDDTDAAAWIGNVNEPAWYVAQYE